MLMLNSKMVFAFRREMAFQLINLVAAHYYKLSADQGSAAAQYHSWTMMSMCSLSLRGRRTADHQRLPLFDHIMTVCAVTKAPKSMKKGTLSICKQREDERVNVDQVMISDGSSVLFGSYSLTVCTADTVPIADDEARLLRNHD
jgi:hypothetical protein